MHEPKPLLELQDDDAALLADWYAVAYDLRHVISATKLLLALLQQQDPDESKSRTARFAEAASYPAARLG